MTKIAIFDSGLGSLSIIIPLRKRVKLEIIYFADQKHFPYGYKSVQELRKIIFSTIKTIMTNFNPDLIVVGSNTPSLLLQNFSNKKVIGVLPPVKKAITKTKTQSIGLLVTNSVAKSIAMQNFIKKNIPRKIKVSLIDSSELVSLVESGKFIDKETFCEKKIETILSGTIKKNNIDVIMLSSTHLPFLVQLFQKQFPNITFLDPAEEIVEKIINKVKIKNMKRSSLKIFSSGDVQLFQKQLRCIGIKNLVKSL